MISNEQKNPALTPDDIVRRGQCMACGFCTVAVGRTEPAGWMEFDDARGHHVPKFSGPPPVDFVCPGVAMDMPELALQKHGVLPADPMLGAVKQTRAAFATDLGIRSRAASGGVIPALLIHLFETGQIDCVYCVEPGTTPDSAAGVVIRKAVNLGSTHGSVYHPVNFGANLHELVNGNERFAFVALPCEIAALEMLKRRHPELASRHVMSIGLFCGGINTFAGVAYYLAGFGLRGADIEQIAYRHGGWPGRLRVKLRGRPDPVELPRIRGNTRWKILRYVVAFQGYWMLPRCRICPDQVADFADIAVGDPHLQKFRDRGGMGFSAVVTRSSRGEALVAAALAAGVLASEALSSSELILSQGHTLDNRRRAHVYASVARHLGFHPPEIQNYDALYGTERIRHYVSAWVDMGKLAVRGRWWARPFYVPWQVFEYLFLTYTPRMIWRRLVGLVTNR